MYQFAEPILMIYIEDQKAQIEADLEEQLKAAYFADTISLGDVSMDLEIEPQAVVISADGLDIRVQGHASAPQGECMTERDTDGSIKTQTSVPPLSDNTGTTEFALVLSDDIANQALYAVWRSGLLCYDLANADFELPFPLNTSLLGIVGGEGFQELFPESLPMAVVTSPDQAPTVDYQSNADLTAVAREPVLYSASEGGVVLENLAPDRLEQMRGMLLAMDPPKHIDYRRPLAPSFKARVIASLEATRTPGQPLLPVAHPLSINYPIVAGGQAPAGVRLTMPGTVDSFTTAYKRNADNTVSIEAGAADPELKALARTAETPAFLARSSAVVKTLASGCAR